MQNVQSNEDLNANPYDTSQDKVRAQALKDELAQAEQSLENDFVEYLVANLDEKSEDLFFDDKKAFFTQILQMQNQYYKEKVGNKQQELVSLEQNIRDKESLQGIAKAQEEFLQKHPEADMQELTEFYNEDLGNKYKNELSKLQPNDFFEYLYQIFQSARGGATEQKQGLPKQLQANGYDVEKGAFNANEDLPMTRI